MKKEIVEVEASFLKVIDPLLMCEGVVNTQTGVCVNLGLIDKIVVSYVNNKASFFNSLSMQMFESQDTIAEALGVNRKTITRSMQKLESVGLINRDVVYANNSALKSKPMPKTYYKEVNIINNKMFIWQKSVTKREFDKNTNIIKEYVETQEYIITNINNKSSKPKLKEVQQEYIDEECPF